MSNALATLQNFNLSTMMAGDALSQMMGSFDSAQNSLGGTSATTMSFKGRSFYVKSGGSSVELPTRNVDVYIVAMRDTDHLSFYETEYGDGQEVDPDKTFTRDFRQGDLKTSDWLANKPANEAHFKSRTRKRRVVLLLDNDQEQKLVIADLGELSVYAPRDTNLGLFNLSQLTKQFASMRKHNPQIMPFMFKLQMSFTSDSVPVVQFSFQDQLHRDPANPFRVAPDHIINRAVEAWNKGEVQELLDLWIDTGATPAQPAQTATAQPAPTANTTPSFVPPVWTNEPVPPLNQQDVNTRPAMASL